MTPWPEGNANGLLDRDLSRRQASWLLAAVAVSLMSVRALLNGYVPGPIIFTDELHYVELARGFAEGHRMLFAGRDTYFPNWIYPILIALPISGWPMPQAHQAIVGLNAVIGSLTVLPAYWWARALAGRRRALAAGSLVGLLPGIGYSGMVMADCLFLLTMTLSLWLAYRAILQPTFVRCALAGFAAGFGFHVKPQALLIPLIIAGTVLWFESDRLRAGWTVFVRAVAPHWATALGWAVGMAPRLLEVVWLERPGEPVTVQTILGGYFGTAVGVQPVMASRFVLSLVGCFAGWTLATGLWPAWHLAGEIHAALTLRNDRAAHLMSQLAAVATLGMLVLVARHTLTVDDTWRLHERYFFVVLPPTLILFATREQVEAAWRRGIALRLLALIAAAAAFGWITRLTGWHVLSDSPTSTGLLTVTMPGEFVHKTGVVVFWVVGALAIAAWLLASGTTAGRVGTVALLFVWLNLGWYLAHHEISRRFVGEAQSVAREVAKRLSPGDRLLILADSLPQDIIWQAEFRNAGWAVALDISKGPWWAHPMRVGSDLRVHSPFPQERTWLLASRRWKFNKEPVEAFAAAALYKLGDQPPLQFAPTQPVPAELEHAKGR